jgi:hypothetical protein
VGGAFTSKPYAISDDCRGFSRIADQVSRLLKFDTQVDTVKKWTGQFVRVTPPCNRRTGATIATPHSEPARTRIGGNQQLEPSRQSHTKSRSCDHGDPGFE